MIGSLWRYSHFILALVSALFIIVASVTGAILAIEPISEVSQRYAVTNLSDVRLSETLKVLEDNYNEVLEIEVSAEDFVKASVFTKKAINETIYINPITGDKLGEVSSQAPFFSFITNLHRSLFLKSIGRGFVGIVSFLLCFIAITGLFLLAQRQGGFKKWFTKVKEKDFTQRYHVILARWFLVPIIILAVTGVYLSLEKFSFLPNNSIEHNWTATPSEIETKQPISEFTLFQNLTLNEVRKFIFPFSEDPEDYFQIALDDRELLVHQYTGEIISEVHYPFLKIASSLSMQLHTGQGSLIWSIILILASLSLLFFIFSGFAMSLKRRRNSKTIPTEWTKDEAQYILLVGSETGSTYAFSEAYCNALKSEGQKVYISTLNEYTTYENATHLIVFTATYGDGDAPSNARKFEAVFNTIEPTRKLQFSVLGFGSLIYPQYCHFAIKVDAMFHSHSSFQPLNPLVKINDQSEISFSNWVKTWNEHTGMNLKYIVPDQKKKAKKEQSFKVIERTSLNIDNTSLIRLRPKKKGSFQSGDLLNIIPPGDTYARQYSIAKVDGDILLSIKWHPKGICSTYLCTLKDGDTISARIENNVKFHFPKQASSVWLIANGTGIAPYLGMLSENRKTPMQLTWGGRVETSFDCYRAFLESKLLRKQATPYQVALSQIKDKMYVQDLLLKQQTEVISTLKNGGVIMLCGSIAMQYSVLDTLEEITTTNLQQPLSYFENNGQLLMDCY
ncbi:MAG: sulfite reductase (NADPH) flavoprotein alpha-component [Sediminicola sp.]|jgi:sulfite reductase (NADPH) flavoprotein alpha-component